MSSRQLVWSTFAFLLSVGPATEVAAICPDATTPPVAIPIEESLRNLTVENPIDPTVVVISEQEFHSLLYDKGWDFQVARKPSLERAVAVGTTANHPNTVGVSADYQTGLTEDLDADVFIVLQDPKTTPDGKVEGTRSYIVAVESAGLPVESWVGTNVRFLSSGSVSTPPNACGCDSSSPLCFDIGGGMGGGFCNGPDCPNPVLTVKGLNIEIVTDPAVFGWSVASDDCSPYSLNLQRASGQYNTAIFAFQGPPEPGGGFPQEPESGGVGCELCNQIQCVEPIFDYGDLTLNPPTPDCSSGNSNVPAICTQVTGGPDDLPLECLPHQAPVLSAAELGVCLGAGSPGNPVSGNAQMYTTGQDVGFADCKTPQPRICQYVDVGTDSDFCSPERKAVESAAWAILATCSGDSSDSPIGGGPAGFQCCDGEAQCGCTYEAGNGVEVCTSCDDSTCSPVIRRTPFDPTVVETSADCEASGGVQLDFSTGVEEGFDWDCSYVSSETEQSIASSEDPVDPNTKPLTPQTQPGSPPPPPTIIAGTTVPHASETAGSKPKGRSENASHDFGGREARTVMERHGAGQSPEDDGGGKPADTTPENRSKRAGDPVLLGSGAVFMAPTDLSFPGPKMPLEFRRFYHSASEDRGHLGSNWSHNWEARLEALRPNTAPSWASRYCREWYPFATCLLYHDGEGGQSLYSYDPESNLYKPSAGAFGTVRPVLGGGWIYREPDGTLRHFNAHGYLIRVIDRFGNGFRVGQQRTPLFAAYQRYCRRTSAQDVGDATDAPIDVDPRVCSYMAAIFGDQGPLDLTHEGWHGGLSAPTDDNVTTRFDYEPREEPLSEHLELVAQGRLYLEYLLEGGYFPHANHGARRYRPVSVTDDLGRSLDFEYEPYDRAPLQNPVTAGLLVAVSGPAGSRIEFSYSRPPDYPRRLQESFLVEVLRTGYTSDDDRVDDSRWVELEMAAAPRRYVYTYQWPENTAPGDETWHDYEVDVRDSYLGFYGRFLGCGYYAEIPCGGGVPRVAPGNPCFQAEVAVQNYIAGVADNLIFVERSGRHEVQSMFGVDPFSETFDRVTVQQYGGATDKPSLSTRLNRLPSQAINAVAVLADRFSDSGFDGRLVNNLKQTGQYPAFQFEYVAGGPDENGNDRTETRLPPDITRRYPVEAGPFHFPGEIECDPEDDVGDDALCTRTSAPDNEYVDPGLDDVSYDDICDEKTHAFDGDNRLACEPASMDELQATLPGVRREFEYEPPTIPVGEPVLVRSAMTCEQIARAVLSDPFHNDNLSTLKPDRTTGVLNDWKPFLVHGRRKLAAANHQRICQWTKTTDRDGRIVWHGSNFRGQTVVTAEQLSKADWRFTDRFYNADGHLVEERWPEEDDVQGRTGWTEYEYEERSHEASAAHRLIPGYWARRANLLRVTEHPPAPVWHEDTKSYSDEYTVRLRYEPLFNQVQSVLRSHTANGDEVPLNETLIEFDYQELQPIATGVASEPSGADDVGWVLRGQIPWGMHFRHKVPEIEDDDSEDPPIQLDDTGSWISSWQFPITMYAGDLNGDGVRGFPTNGGPRASKGKGVPVRIRQIDHQATDPNLAERITYVRWAPHGLPSTIIEPNGRTTRFEYYALPDPLLLGFPAYGEDERPSSFDVSPQFKGFLGRVRWNQHDPNYLPNEATCSGLRGPYKLLLRECSGSVEDDLLGLGLPQQAVDEILRVSNGAEEYVSFSYNETGHTSRVWDGDGRETTIVRDSDGRPVRITDPLQNETTITYTVDGWPFLEETFDNNNVILSQTRRAFDNEGRVLGTCDALVPGACTFAFFPMGDVGTPSDVGQQRRLFRYSREGLLVAESDPEGLVTYHDYDDAQRLIRTRTPDPAAPLDDARARQTEFVYDLLNRLVQRTWGTPTTQAALGTLEERFEYDGRHRLVTYIDKRTSAWQYGYSARNERVAVKQSDFPYEFGGDPNPFWEIRYEYNGFSELVYRNEHGIVETELLRTDDGRVWGEKATGRGVRMFGYDTSGRVVYTRDPFLNETVSLRNPDAVAPQCVGYPDSHQCTPGTRTTLSEATVELRRPREGGPSSGLWDPGGFICVDCDVVVPLPGPWDWTKQGPEPLTTTAIDAIDGGGHLAARRLIGHDGGEQVDRWGRNGLGHVLQMTNAEQAVTLYTRNLLGWPVQESVERDLGFDTASFTYNTRGQQTSVTDPAGQVTTTRYNGFGDVLSTTKPGYSAPHELWTYDGYGRAASLELASEEILRFDYDPITGDPVRDRWFNSPLQEKTLATRTYDALGRLRQSVYHNLAALAESNTISDERVTHDWVYDPLGRVTSESMTISDQLQVTSKYSHIPNDSLLGWERAVDYPSGSLITEYIDLDGKLAGVDVEGTQYGDDRYSSTSYRWLGDLYAGSTHGWADPRFNAPLREIARFDEFGRRTQWTYDPYHRDEQGNAVEGGPCGYPFDPHRCNDPLLHIEGVRDVMGRLRSVKSRFAYPRWSLPTFDPLPTNQPWEWSGYEYDRRSYFTGEWTATSTTEPVVGSIVPNAATNLDVQTTGGALAATPWVRERETEVGGLVSIYDGSAPNPDPVWFADPRADGHRLTRVDIDRASFAITHDESGRLTHGLDYDFVYDPRGRLAAAKDATGVVEVYLYDADGRLAYVHRPQSGESESYAYDGDRMVAAFDENAMTLWEAVWGPKQDQLVEWHDLSVDRWYTVLRDHRNSPVGTFDTWEFYMTETAAYTPEGRLSVFAHDGTPTCTEPGDATEVCLGPSNLPFGFNSMWRSPVTGLTHMRARWYSPRLGQFVTHDPLGYLDLYSPYGFAAFDPINGWDPFGLFSSQYVPRCKSLSECLDEAVETQGEGLLQSTLRSRQEITGPSFSTPTLQNCLGAACALTTEQYNNIIKFGIEETILNALGAFAFRISLASLRTAVGSIPAGLKARLAAVVVGTGKEFLGEAMSLLRRLHANEFGTLDIDVFRAFQSLLTQRIRGIAGFANKGQPIIVDNSLGANPQKVAEVLRGQGVNARSVNEIFGEDPKDPAIRALAENIGGRVVASDRGRDVGGGFGNLAIRVDQRARTPEDVARIVIQNIGERK